jgi:hypothetical protein
MAKLSQWSQAEFDLLSPFFLLPIAVHGIQRACRLQAVNISSLCGHSSSQFSSPERLSFSSAAVHFWLQLGLPHAQRYCFVRKAHSQLAGKARSYGREVKITILESRFCRIAQSLSKNAHRHHGSQHKQMTIPDVHEGGI